MFMHWFVSWLHLMGELAKSLALTEGESHFHRISKNSIGTLSLLPSAANAADTFLIRGRQELRLFVSWLHLMGELSPKVTEGEKPLGRYTNPVFAA